MPKPVVVVVVVVVVEVLLFSSPAEAGGVGLLSNNSVEELGLGAVQAIHLESDGLFCTKQTSHSHEPAGGLNKLPNPTEEEREEVVEVEEVAVDCVVVCWGAVSGPEELQATGEAKPGALRRSSTLPCLRTLAGLKGPSKSSVLLLVVDFTAVTVGVVSFPFDTEGSNFATGALKVNPAEGEKEGGLAAVALTMGEAKVKGSHGGVEAAGGSLTVRVSLGGVAGMMLEAGLTVLEEVRGGRGEEKLKVGKLEVLMGSETAGRSGTSTTSFSSGRLEETRALLLSLFILPPAEPELLAAGVLERG